MDNPQTKTEEVLDVLNKYNYSVDSLQLLAWTELGNLGLGKEFTNKQKDIIRCKRLTKLEEVGYVLQLIGDLNRDQSTELRRRIEELEGTKCLLERESRKLRERIRYTDDLLEQAVVENEELVEKLRQKGLSEKEFKKQLKKQQLNTEGDTVQRLKIALENTRRELDIIHRTRSPTPSLSEELKSSGLKIPKIVIDPASEETQVEGDVIEAVPTGEGIASELVGRRSQAVGVTRKTRRQGSSES